MKTIITFLLSVLTLSLTAQTVTVTFQGNANRGRNYQVVVDGVSYFSANSISSNGRSTTTIENLSPGSHRLDVYVLGANNTAGSDGSSNQSPSAKAAYSKIFQLRQGYDMNISVRGKGLVSFTEKKAKAESVVVTGTPMSSTDFNRLVQTVRAKRYQSDKITAIRNALNTPTNMFTTSQVKQLLTLINAESRRLELAKLSYSSITDKANFSYLYDVLASEASRDALDDYVVSHGGSIISTDDNAAYAAAMSEASFNILLSRTTNYFYQADRINEMRTAFSSNNNYFNTAQVKQLLALVSSETERLALAKSSYTRVVDKNNFNQVVDLFYSQSNRNDLNSFITANGGVANNNNYTTAMTDASFVEVYNKARGHFFQKNTVNDVRTALNTSSNHFSTEQVKKLLTLVVNETTRLELAKIAYARTVDTYNFTQLLDLFTVTSNRTDLDNYIKAQK